MDGPARTTPPSRPDTSHPDTGDPDWLIGVDWGLSPQARAMVLALRQATKRLNPDAAQGAGFQRLRRQVRRLDEGLLWLPARRHNWTRGRVGGVRVRQVTDTAVVEPRVLLYLHGGGFFVRTLNAHLMMAARIARAAGADRMVMPVYRLAPEHQYPAPVDDCLSVYAALLGSGIEPERIVVAGDSAGGALVVSMLLHARRWDLPMPAAMALLSPLTDMAAAGGSVVTNAGADPVFSAWEVRTLDFYLGAARPDHPLAAPLAADLRGLPPLLVHVGSTEMLLDDSVRLGARAHRAGVDVRVEVHRGLPHVWHLMGLPESRRAIDAVGTFLAGHLPGGTGR